MTITTTVCLTLGEAAAAAKVEQAAEAAEGVAEVAAGCKNTGIAC